MRRYRGCLVAILMHGALAHAAAAPEAPASSEYQPPQVKLRPAPASDSLPNRDGIIRIAVDISATGQASNARVIEGGFGSKQLGSRILQRLKDAKFEPAREDGVPVPVEGWIVTQRVAVLDPGSVASGNYQQKLKKALGLIGDGNYAGARTEITATLAANVASISEYIELQRQLAMAYSSAGKPHHALLAARETLSGRIWYSGRAVISVPAELGVLHMQLAASQGLLSEALGIYDRLASQAEVALPASAATLASQWRSEVQSIRPLTGQIELTEEGRWTHDLTRRRFTIQNVEGSISIAYVSCASPLASRKLTPGAGNVFATPSADPVRGLCTLHISGAPGTRFEIVEIAGGA